MITEYKGRFFTEVPGLRRVRNASGLSQEKLAEKAGVSKLTILRIEKRSKPTTLQTLGKLSRALGVDPDELLARESAEERLAKLDHDSEGVEDQYVGRYAMGGEHADPVFEADVAEVKLREFREAGSTDDAFREVATDLLQLGKDRARYLAGLK